jgi:hypothetical protein
MPMIREWKHLLMSTGYAIRSEIDRGLDRSSAMEKIANGMLWSIPAPVDDHSKRGMQAFISIAPSFALAWAESAFSVLAPNRVPDEHWRGPEDAPIAVRSHLVGEP